MKAYVTIQNFGEAEQKQSICEFIRDVTMFHAYVDDRGNVVMPCQVEELGLLMSQLAGTTGTNWIEYTVQFDC